MELKLGEVRVGVKVSKDDNTIVFGNLSDFKTIGILERRLDTLITAHFTHIKGECGQEPNIIEGEIKGIVCKDGKTFSIKVESIVRFAKINLTLKDL